MFDPQVSFVRVLIGDPAGVRYSDAEIREACANAIKPGPAAPSAEPLRMPALLAAKRFPK